MFFVALIRQFLLMVRHTDAHIDIERFIGHCAWWVVWLCMMQVQLLVSDSDVESYKQIKFDLDELRLLVEKSELWVYKSKSEGKAEKMKSEDADRSVAVINNFGLRLW